MVTKDEFLDFELLDVRDDGFPVVFGISIVFLGNKKIYTDEPCLAFKVIDDFLTDEIHFTFVGDLF